MHLSYDPDDIFGLWAKGWPTGKIAKELSLSYATVYGQLRNTGRRANISARGIDDGVMRSLHAEGLKNAEIAKKMCCDRNTVTSHLKKMGLTPNSNSAYIDMNHNDVEGRCSKCHKVLPIDMFQVKRNKTKYTYRLSYCRDCRRKQQYDSINATTKGFIRFRVRNLRDQCKKRGLEMGITEDYVVRMYNNQQGKCVYTRKKMQMMTRGKGKFLWDSMSFDRIDPGKGYVVGNVVLCTRRANAIKFDQTPQELKKWMPLWYKRLMKWEPPQV